MKQPDNKPKKEDYSEILKHEADEVTGKIDEKFDKLAKKFREKAEKGKREAERHEEGSQAGRSASALRAICRRREPPGRVLSPQAGGERQEQRLSPFPPRV